ncbi:alpha/beta fold hydrolase [Corynebacterium glutamicum]|uniref:alpha/beta fold hydrolase n=1 Tax=Corynebacterium glutamicum TaxID=1718 RepID=UPI0014683074|nr:alpha/beta fold hydrolase [Corynebacterium glutamicum]GFK17752.1 alpha/beta hydrolase [Corynebacterium glutamicum]
MITHTAPHASISTPQVTSHRGRFWIAGDVVESDFGPAQRGPLYVEWEVKDPATTRPALVLIHGGGGQGTDWLSTVDGRPGWAHHFVESGYPVYVVDRAGHGRSPYHPAVVGPMGPAFVYPAAQGLFVPQEKADVQTGWAWGREPGDPQFDQLVAGFGPLPDDLGYSQELDADRIAQLLDQIGPAILVTHSAGGPVGWVVADRRPELVRAIVSVEPMGPAFVEFPGIGKLDWGLTAAPVTYDPPLNSPEEVEKAAPESRRMPGVAGKDILILTGGASAFADFADEVVDFLNHGGAQATHAHLPDHGIFGNGHAVMQEQNSDQTIRPVLEWLEGR